MARAREVLGLDCEEPFARAAVRVIELRATEVFEHSSGVLDLDDIERLHDMRVATRRLRAAIEVFGSCFPAKRRRKALKRVKALADALGERRDRDIAIEFVEARAGELAEADGESLGALVATLREERWSANEELAPYVAPQRLRRLQRSLRKLVEAAKA